MSTTLLERGVGNLNKFISINSRVLIPVALLVLSFGISRVTNLPQMVSFAVLLSLVTLAFYLPLSYSSNKQEKRHLTQLAILSEVAILIPVLIAILLQLNKSAKL